MGYLGYVFLVCLTKTAGERVCKFSFPRRYNALNTDSGDLDTLETKTAVWYSDLTMRMTLPPNNGFYGVSINAIAYFTVKKSTP
jgi:hypothetical protein